MFAMLLFFGVAVAQYCVEQIPLGLIESKLTHILLPFHRIGPIISPQHLLPTSSSSSSSRPRSISQRDRDAYMREKRRMERVTVGGAKASGQNAVKSGTDTLKGFEAGMDAATSRRS